MMRAWIAFLLFLPLLVQAAPQDPQVVTLDVVAPMGGARLQGVSTFSVVLEAVDPQQAAPVALLSADRVQGQAPLQVTFRVAASGAPTTGWSLDFGDGSATSGSHDLSFGARQVTHTYGPGQHEAVLRVQGQHGHDEDRVAIHAQVGPSAQAMLGDPEPGDDGTVPGVWGELGQLEITDDATHLHVSLELAGLLDGNVPEVLGTPFEYWVNFRTDHNGVDLEYGLSFQFRLVPVPGFDGPLLPDSVTLLEDSFELTVTSAVDPATGFATLCPVAADLTGSRFADQKAYWEVPLDAFRFNNFPVACNGFTANGRALMAGDVLAGIVGEAKFRAGIVVFNGAGDVATSPDYTLTGGTRVDLPPTASLAVDDSVGPAPHGVTFTMAASDDEGIASWSLDVDGDGLPDASGAGLPPPTTTHVYDDPGSYLATLRVEDTRGQAATDTVTVIVQPADQDDEEEEPVEGPPLSGTLRVRESTCDGRILREVGVGPVQGKARIQFPFDANLVGEGQRRLAFCYSGDGFVPVQVMRDVIVARTPSPPAPAAPEPLAPLQWSIAVPASAAPGSFADATVQVQNPDARPQDFLLVAEGPVSRPFEGRLAGQEEETVSLRFQVPSGGTRLTLSLSGATTDLRATRDVAATTVVRAFEGRIDSVTRVADGSLAVTLRLTNAGTQQEPVEARLLIGPLVHTVQRILEPAASDMVHLVVPGAPATGSLRLLVAGTETHALPVPPPIAAAAPEPQASVPPVVRIAARLEQRQDGWHLVGSVRRGDAPAHSVQVDAVADGRQHTAATDPLGRFDIALDGRPVEVLVSAAGTQRTFAWEAPATDKESPAPLIWWTCLGLLYAVARRRQPPLDRSGRSG